MVRYETISEHHHGQRLDNYLLKTLKGVPKSKIYTIIRKGEVRVNKGRKKAHYKLTLGDTVRIPPLVLHPPKVLAPTQAHLQAIENTMIFEDEHLLVINKPTGLAVHSGSGIKYGIIELLKYQYGAHYELVHRLDRATSGILLIAKKRNILKYLHQQLVLGNIKKHYQAIVVGAWAKKTYHCNAALLTTHNKTLVSHLGKQATSIFTPIRNFKVHNTALSLVDIHLKSGRNHQIRVHSAYLNHPVLGDQKYGNFGINNQLKTGRMYLHHNSTTLMHPYTHKYINFTAKTQFDMLPEDYA